jgi:cytidyltransferase-like protein
VEEYLMITVEKPWGKEEILVNNDLYCSKKIYINYGKNFSFQYHKNKCETFYVEKGMVILDKGLDGKALDKDDNVEAWILSKGDSITIPPLTKHRCYAMEDTIIIETSTKHEDSDTYVVNNTVVIASGYFDPIHVGHIEYLSLAKNLGDQLIVIVNNDVQAKLKKKKPFMVEGERSTILKSIFCVDKTIVSIDYDSTVCMSISHVITMNKATKYIFAKGGDRFAEEIPESDTCKRLGITIVDGLGEKIRSSSDLIKGAI